MFRSPLISRLRGRRISPITKISLVVLGIFLPLALLGLWLGRKPAIASWFDDSFSYRNSIPISSHTSAETNVYISITIDTSTSGQFQSDCGDLRFTTVGGDLLPYYIVSGCGTATTVIHVFFQSFPAGAQTIYYYYGNPTADNGFSGTDFATEATGYVIGATGSQEKGGAPVAYWKFDDGTGTNAQDSSPNNNDGTITGATWQTSDQCVSDKCLSFDGSNDVVTVANSVAGVQSVSFWVRPITTSEQFIDLNGSATLLASSGTITASGFTSPTIYVDGRVSSTIAANKWQHIMVTTASGLTGSAIKIGQISTNYGQAFIDDIKIYNYARTAAQVKADFAGRGTSKGSSVRVDPSQGSTLSNGLVGYWKMDESTANSCTGGVNDSCDSSGNGNDLVHQTTFTSASGKFGNSQDFETSTSDYLSINDNASLSITGSLTIAAWINTESLTNGQIVAKDATGGRSYYLRQFSTSIRFVVSSDGTNATAYRDSATTITNGTWVHIIGVYDSVQKTMNIYRNGELDNSTLTGTVPSSIYDSTTSFRIGNDGNDSGGYFDGKIDETRIYNRALSPKEVRDLYNWAPGPAAYLNMDEGSGTSANDISGNSRTGTLNDGPVWNAGKYGKGIKLDGSNDDVSVPDFGY